MPEAGAVQVWQPDLSKTGGITESIRIAALASALRIPINPHSSATGLNHASSLHFLAATANSGYFEACVRSEEHPSELQSLLRHSYAVFCLKKKTKNTQHTATTTLMNTSYHQ